MTVPPPLHQQLIILCLSLSSTKRKEDIQTVASLLSSDTKSTIFTVVITCINFVPSFVSNSLDICWLCSHNGLIWICAVYWTLDRLHHAAPESLTIRCAFVLAVDSATDSRSTGRPCACDVWMSRGPADWRPAWSRTARNTHETSS
jgi:hypothetical protein